MTDRRRVVVTGLGWVTSLGSQVSAVFADLLAGKSGIKPITRFDVKDFAVKFGGEISDWEGGPHLDKREARRLDRFSQFALSAAIDAVAQSGLDFTGLDPYRCGSVVGSGIGGIEEFESGYRKMIDKGPDRVSPFMVPKLMCNAASGNISIRWQLRGPNYATTSACASAAHAIGDAATLIRNNQADVMVTGGSEAALTPLGLACFIAPRALSTRNDSPTTASRPFDKDRDGFVLSEGAGILVLEEYEHARKRGAPILAEFLGFGQSADAIHITAPDEEGRSAAAAMDVALKDAGVNVTDVDYINAHGTSTPLGDLAETRALKRLFKDHAHRVPISSTKSMTGHLLGAAGGIEAVIVVEAIRQGVIPPTINYTTPDPDCDLDYVPNTARQARIRTALSNSFGFGGHNVSLVFGSVR